MPTRRSVSEIAAEVNGNGAVTPSTEMPEASAPPIPLPPSPAQVGGAAVDGTLTYKFKVPPPQTPTARPAVAYNAENAAPASYGARIVDLDGWLTYWKTYPHEEIGLYADPESFTMVVLRERDPLQSPHTPRPFRVPAPEPVVLGEYPFTVNLNIFIAHLQSINGNSGGRFRITLKDGDGTVISPLSGWEHEQNGVWSGVIGNPVMPDVEASPTAAAKKSPEDEEDEYLTRMARRITNMRAIGLLPKEDADKRPSLREQLEDAAIPALMTTLVSSVTAAAAAINAPPASAEDESVGKMIARNVLNDPEKTQQVLSLVGTGVESFGSVLSGFFGRRRERAPSPAPAQPNPPADASAPSQVTAPAPDNAQSADAPATEDPVDLVEYLFRACEQSILPDFANDARLLEFKRVDPVSYGYVRGMLRSNAPADVLETLIARCEKQGRGERARLIATLPQAVMFIEHLQEGARR